MLMRSGAKSDSNDEGDKSHSDADSEPQNRPEAPKAQGSWQFIPSADQKVALPIVPSQPISWTASEYIHRHKNVGWFAVAFLAIAGISALSYFITHDMISMATFVIIGLVFTIFAARAPRTLEYSVDNVGVHIGQRSYPYGNFHSFSILEEDVVRSILLMPARRFGLPLAIHYDPADEAKIIDVLSGHLPIEERQLPPVDRLMAKIHF